MAAPAVTCKVCATVSADTLAELEKRAAARQGRPRLAAYVRDAGYALGENAIRVHLDHLRPSLPPEPVEVPGEGARLELDGDRLTVETGPVEGDRDSELAAVFARFGKDPALWTLEHGRVRESAWEVAYRDDDGEMQARISHSWRATFVRREVPLGDLLDVEALRAEVKAWTIPPAFQQSPADETPSTLLVSWADWQVGKLGTRETVARVRESIVKSVHRFQELQAQGRNVEGIAIANLGDPAESCGIGSTLFELELNRRDQLTLCLDLWLEGVKALLPLAEVQTFVSVLCNHGHLSREGGKRNVTDDADNAGGLLADTLKRVLDGRDDFDAVRWVVPRDEMVVTANLSGVEVAFAHGHTMTGKPEQWMLAQSTALLRRRRVEPRLWVTAHSHHLRVQDLGPWTWFQAPALDSGSKWFEDIRGTWSTPGTLTMLVGEHDERGWSDLAVL